MHLVSLRYDPAIVFFSEKEKTCLVIKILEKLGNLGPQSIITFIGERTQGVAVLEVRNINLEVPPRRVYHSHRAAMFSVGRETRLAWTQNSRGLQPGSSVYTVHAGGSPWLFW